MEYNLQQIKVFLVPVLVCITSVFAGFVFQYLVISNLSKLAKKTHWKGDDIIIKSLKGVVVLLFFLIGLYVSVQISSFSVGVQKIVQKILIAGIIFSVFWVFSKVISDFVVLYGKKLEGRMSSLSLFANFFRVLVMLIGGLVIFQTLGIKITPVLTALGVGGLAVALALQDTLANMFAGFHIAMSGQLRPGDYVKLDSGEEGVVEDITWRNTTIKKIRNNMIVIPNSKLANSVITNYDLPKKEMTIIVPVGVAYDSDLEKVERVTIEVGKEIMKTVPGGVADFEPLVRYHTFNDSSIDFNVVLRCNEFVNQYLLKHEFVKKLHKQYNIEGIEIPFPIRTIQMEKEA